MKNRSVYFLFFLCFYWLVFSSCRKKKEEEQLVKEVILPASFMIDLPDAIHYSFFINTVVSTTDTILDGKIIYKYLGNIMNMGVSVPVMVETLLSTLSQYNITRPVSLSFQSIEDGRTKNMIILQNSGFSTFSYEFIMIVYDAIGASNADGGKALQIMWNRKPLKGYALIKPRNLNIKLAEKWNEGLATVEYNETRDLGFDAWMMVSIAGLPVGNSITGMNTLKMFVGRTDDIIDFYGNSNHPNLYFLNQDTVGYNIAFVGSGNLNQNIAVAEIGIPFSSEEKSSRSVLLNDYAIKNVFSHNLKKFLGGTADSLTLVKYVINTSSPGYYSGAGFVQSGIAPASGYASLQSRLALYTPFKPKDIAALSINY